MSYLIIDTHSHLNFSAFKNDAEKVIERCLSENFWIINIGSQFETSKRAVELAEKYEKGVYAAVGMHPIHVETGVFKPKLDPEEETADRAKEKIFNAEKYKKLALSGSRRVVAIGETGLDYYYRPKTKTRQEIFKQAQKEVFLKHLELAKELNLPVIFHCRSAHDDLIEILRNNPGIQGVVHCFSGTLEQAKKYLEMGFYIGFTGIIFKLNLDDVIKQTPIEKILIETDCPYLLPSEALAKEGLTGISRNEPIFVKYVAQKIAELKNTTFEKVAQKTTENAKNLFGI